jgi:hypothetical protein
MARGLFWLSLLIVISILTWLGWNEYQKVEYYRIWAEKFDQAKYDIYAVLGQKKQIITVGKPTRKGIVETKTFSLQDVRDLRLLVNNQPVNLESLPNQGDPVLEFNLTDNSESIKVPFTELELAVKWFNYLGKLLK